jgi:hypothetical protein
MRLIDGRGLGRHKAHLSFDSNRDCIAPAPNPLELSKVIDA